MAALTPNTVTKEFTDDSHAIWRIDISLGSRSDLISLNPPDDRTGKLWLFNRRGLEALRDALNEALPPSFGFFSDRGG